MPSKVVGKHGADPQHRDVAELFCCLSKLGGVVVRKPTLELAKGKHELAVRILGANPAAVPAHMFGLDYVRLVPAAAATASGAPPAGSEAGGR